MKKIIIALLSFASLSSFAATGNVNVTVGKTNANILIDGEAAKNISDAMVNASRSRGGLTRVGGLRTIVTGNQVSCATISTIVYRTTCSFTLNSKGVASISKAEINDVSVVGKAVAGGFGDYSNVTISGAAGKALAGLLKNAQGQDISCSASTCQFSVDSVGSVNRNFAK